jgi:hypothetical protein
MVVLFLLFLRKLYTDFHSGCTKLHPYQKCVRSFFSLLSHLNLCSCWQLVLHNSPFSWRLQRGWIGLEPIVTAPPKFVHHTNVPRVFRLWTQIQFFQHYFQLYVCEQSLHLSDQRFLSCGTFENTDSHIGLLESEWSTQ